MKERRDKILCYTCDEKFHHGHKFKNKIFIIGVYDIEDWESEVISNDLNQGDTVEEEVSLNSLSNSLNPRIFRIRTKQGAESLEVLIDTGINNNFNKEMLAEKL